jgi:hypothetical protein
MAQITPVAPAANSTLRKCFDKLDRAIDRHWERAKIAA